MTEATAQDPTHKYTPLDDTESSQTQLEDEVFVFPASFAQQRLWFLDQLGTNNPGYNIASALRLTGPLNLRALEEGLNTIIERHETLRTTFEFVDGQVSQIIKPRLTAELAVEDLESLPAPERDDRARQSAADEVQAPFNLAEGPLIRAKIIRLAEAQHLLVVTIYHIISDGWSIGVLFRELSALYNAICLGQSASLPELPIQYADFTVWQREHLRGEMLESLLAYWRNQLGHAPSLLDLPTDFSRPPVQTYRGARQELVLSEKLSQELRDLGQQSGATIFMALLAVFQTLLHRLTGQTDIVVGSPIAGRNQAEVENLIGFFINTVALNTSFSGNPTFREILQRVRQVAVGGYAHQELPFEKLVEELQPERNLSHSPVFQVFFNMLNLEDIDPTFRDVAAERFWAHEPESKFDLTLYAEETNRRIMLTAVYNIDLFRRERIQELLNQFHELLTQIVTDPDRSIAAYSLVTPRSAALLPDPVSALPMAAEATTVHALFGQQATRVPDNLALTDAHTSLTYAELDRASNRLANALLAAGVQAQDVVAIYGSRSAALVVALLGVLKCGAAFTILDPTYPVRRHIDYLKIARASAWLEIDTGSRIPAALEKYVKESTISCRITLPEDDPLRALQDYLTAPPDGPIRPSDMAYIAFSSGSTGVPKAIQGSHQPISHFIEWHCRTFDLSERDRFSMLSGLPHDPLLRDIFTPLSLGASLFIPDLLNQAPGELKAWLQENEISIVHLTPAMLGLIGPSPAESNGQNTFLRYAFFGGDLLTDQHLASLSQFAPKATAVNFYGTTETPQAMGFFIVPKPEIADIVESKTEFRRVPLGQGIDDVQLLILNGSEQLAGPGELGELYVRTPYLSDGYLDEELTRERFVINPLTGQAHDLLFRTGDLARYLPDGNVEFVGRADKQVKIRGFRIELGEVESALRQHPDLRDAVVICRSNRSEETSAGSATDKVLAAYLVPNQDTPPGPDKLHSFLTDKLPAYMIPSAYVPIEKIPLTSNGKVDFGSLPEPDSPSPRHSAFAKPHGAAERRLAQIWSDLLHVDRIGRTDSFFELGGHSLLAVQLFEQIEASFGRKLPLATLFQAPTIDQLARLVSQNTEVTISTKSLVAIQPAGSRPSFFCVHGIGGHVLRYYDLPLYLGENQPFYGLQSQGLDGHQEACQNIKEMAAHYIEEIRTVQNEGPYLVGGLSLGSYVAYEMACQLERQGDHVGLVALFDGHASTLPGYSEALSRIGRIRHLERSLAEKIKYHTKNLSRLSPSQQAQYVQRVITRKVPNGGRDHHQVDNDSVPDHLQKVYWTNGLAMSQYIPGPYPGKITLFRANASRGTYHGWDDFALGGVDIYDIPGNHTSIVDEPNVTTLAQKLEMCIDNVLHDQVAGDKNSNPSNLAVKQAYKQL